MARQGANQGDETLPYSPSSSSPHLPISPSPSPFHSISMCSEQQSLKQFGAWDLTCTALAKPQPHTKTLLSPFGYSAPRFPIMMIPKLQEEWRRVRGTDLEIAAALEAELRAAQQKYADAR